MVSKVDDVTKIRLANNLLGVINDLIVVTRVILDSVPDDKIELDNFNIPDFIKQSAKPGEDDMPIAHPPKCVHGLLFTEPCPDCANNREIDYNESAASEPRPE